MLPTIVDRDCLPPEPRCPLPRDNRLGSGQRAAGLQRETIVGNNPLHLLDAVPVLQGVKAKVPSPNSFTTMAEITPTTVLLW